MYQKQSSMFHTVTIHTLIVLHFCRREKISHTIELFREVSHPAAKGEEAGEIFAKYEQLHSGLAM